MVLGMLLDVATVDAGLVDGGQAQTIIIGHRDFEGHDCTLHSDWAKLRLLNRGHQKKEVAIDC